MRCWGCDRFITSNTCYYSAVLTRVGTDGRKREMERKVVCSDCYPIYKGIMI